MHEQWPDQARTSVPDNTDRVEPVGAARAQTSDAGPAAPPALEDLLDYVIHSGGSDLILSPGTPPRARIDSDLYLVGDVSLSADDTLAYSRRLLHEHHRDVLSKTGSVDFGFDWHGAARFRGNAYIQRGTTAISLRHLPGVVPRPEELGIPATVAALAKHHNGLVLVTGPTGSGKSTTIASLLSTVNETRACHIITIEDPIEYRFGHRMAVVDQREVGVDTPSFNAALRAVLREDPDVVLVGEMRDQESISSTVTVAETGHLVFATLHANDAPQAIDRIIDVFPGDQQSQIRSQLASSLLAVVHQRLYRRRGGGRVAAYEVLLMNDAVRNLVRERKTQQIHNVMLTHTPDGMKTMDQAVTDLHAQGLIDEAHFHLPE